MENNIEIAERLCLQMLKKYNELCELLSKVEGTDRKAILTRVQIAKESRQLKVGMASFVLAGINIPKVKELFDISKDDIWSDSELYLQEVIDNATCISVEGYLQPEKE